MVRPCTEIVINIRMNSIFRRPFQPDAAAWAQLDVYHPVYQRRRQLPRDCVVLHTVSCADDDDYHYPSVKLDFLTAQAGADGSLQSVLTDEGETLAIVEDASKTRIDANASARIVSNYGKADAADGISGVKLYAVLSAISPVPQSADKF